MIPNEDDDKNVVATDPVMFLFYKNFVYKKVEFEICPKFKARLRLGLSQIVYDLIKKSVFRSWQQKKSIKKWLACDFLNVFLIVHFLII